MDETITADPTEATATQQPTDGAAPAAAAPAEDAAAKPETALDAKAGDSQAAVPADWPDDWREKLASGDDKLLARLKRFAALPNVLNSWLSAEKKISAGEHKRWAPAEGADDAALATWRKERGIPDDPAAYLTDLPGGLLIGEADQPAFDKFAEVFHAQHVPATAGKALVAAYFDAQRAAQDAMWERDETQRREAVDSLRAEMGPDYPGNISAIRGMLDAAPESVRAAIADARDPSGNKLFNSADVVRFFAGLARELNPVATIVPGNAADAGQTIDAEIASIEGKMGDSHSEYWRGPQSPKSPGETIMQVRYRELIEAKNKLRR